MWLPRSFDVETDAGDMRFDGSLAEWVDAGWERATAAIAADEEH